jgi:hypothetical protein
MRERKKLPRNPPSSQDMLYRLRHIPATCKTMMEKTFTQGMNANKTTGNGKCTPT